MNYISYAHQDLPLKKIKKYSAQYAGVDMWELVGKDESEFPFLIWNSETEFQIMYWTKHSGIMSNIEEDEVVEYALAIWLKENAHPVFSSIKEAEKYSIEREWPKEQNA